MENLAGSLENIEGKQEDSAVSTSLSSSTQPATPFSSAENGYYALYRCVTNRPKVGVASSEEGDVSPDLPKPSGNGPPEFSLNVVACSLDAEQETSLRSVIAKKLSRGNAYKGHGSVTSVDLSHEQDSEALQYDCYYCLLHQASPLLFALESSPDKQSCSQDFVVCFLHRQEGALDLFKQQLDQYCADLLQHLDSQAKSSQKEQLEALETFVRPQLLAWQHANMEFIGRCLQALGNQVALLLHCALLNSQIEVEGTSKELQQDIQKFCECCGLWELMQDSQSDSRSGSLSPDSEGKQNGEPVTINVIEPENQQQQLKVTITLKDGSWTFSDQRCNRYCVEWAKALLKGDQENPSYLKQVVDTYKLKAIQDMNSLKRLIRQAEMDHYALYRGFHFLQTSGNCDILLHHAQASDHTLTTEDARSIIEVLADYSKETSNLDR